MSSFIKNLISKHKEKKYGKGHRLGDTPTVPSTACSAPNNISQPPGCSKSEAARLAGEAALQRLQNLNKPVTQRRPTTATSHSSKNDLEKAFALKEHYFGKQEEVENVSLNPKSKIFFTSSLFQPGERYSIEEVEDKIEQHLMDNLEMEPILVSVTLLFTANYKNKEKLDKCVEILNRFADNIINNPTEEKYRKIRLENAIFKEKVYTCKYADLVLKQSGFQTRIIKLEDGKDDDVFLFEGDDWEKLENLKSALSLGEAIVPELDRNIQVLKISKSSKMNDFILSDDFFNLKIEELRKEQLLRNQAVEKAGMLRTKAMRERDEQLELRRYNYSIIRVKFPDDFVLQALFKSNEKFDVLYELVQNSLSFENIPFELIGHSIKKPNTGGNTLMGLSLAELGLVPSAVLNFKISELIDPSIKTRIHFFLKPKLLEQAENF